jgi:4-aminobutyrate aminotransferase/(S)-3-amino-2-methylpropionate transaminase
MPLAAVTGRAEVMDAAGVGGLGGTYSGNPLACAAAIAAIETIEQEKLADRAKKIGRIFDDRASAWAKRWSLIGEVRGLGAMRAIELVRSPQKKEPAKDETERIVRYCYAHGLIMISAGSYGNVLRLLVPLMITDEQLNEGLDILQAAIASVAEVRVELAPRLA